MEDWEHMTTVRELIRRDDSPVGRCDTKVEETRGKMKNQRQVSSDQSPYIEEQNGSKDVILQI